MSAWCMDPPVAEGVVPTLGDLPHSEYPQCTSKTRTHSLFRQGWMLYNPNGVGTTDDVIGGAAVPFQSSIIHQFAKRIAVNEHAHVEFLRSALGSAGRRLPDYRPGPPQVWGSGGNHLRMRVRIIGWVELLSVAGTKRTIVDRAADLEQEIGPSHDSECETRSGPRDAPQRLV
jgi:hypothetical protein